jgi:hypothetical protein
LRIDVDIAYILNVNGININRLAGGMAMGAGVIHLVLAPRMRRPTWRSILGRPWDSITLHPRGAQVAEAEAFWFAPGSFAAPLFGVGLAAVTLANRGQSLPAPVGYVLTGWALATGVLLPRSPIWLIATSAALLVVGERRHRLDQLDQLQH